MRIGLTGYAESGKDEVADQLVEEFGFVKVNMSDALDRYLLILNPIVSKSGTNYATIRRAYSYVDAKRIPEVRRLLQCLGTEVGRAIDPDVWVKELEKEASKHEHVVTTGIRYVNEVTPGMTLIRVDRPGYGPLNNHASEDLEAVFEMAYNVIHNTRDLDGLRVTTRVMATALGLHPLEPAR